MDACPKKSSLNGGFMDASFPHGVHLCIDVRIWGVQCTVQQCHSFIARPLPLHHQHRLGLAAHCKKGSINGSCDCWRRPHCLHMLPRSPVLMTNDQWPLWPIFNHNFTQSCGLFTSKTPGNFSSWKVGPTPSLMMFCYDNDAREF